MVELWNRLRRCDLSVISRLGSCDIFRDLCVPFGPPIEENGTAGLDPLPLAGIARERDAHVDGAAADLIQHRMRSRRPSSGTAQPVPSQRHVGAADSRRRWNAAEPSESVRKASVADYCSWRTPRTNPTYSTAPSGKRTRHRPCCSPSMYGPLSTYPLANFQTQWPLRFRDGCN